MKLTAFYARFSPVILLIAVFMLPIVFAGARRAMNSNKNDVKQWLPAEYEETRVFREFRQHFAGEEFVLVSWDGCTLDDQRVRLMSAKLLPPPDAQAKPEERYFSDLISGPSVIETLTKAPVNLTRSEAIDRLRGSLIGPDGGPNREQTCLVLTVSDAGKKSLKKTIAKIYDTARIECDIPEDQLHLGGPTSDNVAIDKAGEQSLVRLAGLAGAIGLTVSWWCLRSVKLVAIVLTTGIYSAAASLAVVWYSGSSMNAIVLTMPSLVYVAAISGAIHLANYYRDTLHQDGLEGAAGRAVAHAVLPLSLATGTTAVGLLTLCYSELVPIQMFGLYSAIGVVISAVFLFLFLPATLQLFPLREEAKGADDSASPLVDPAFYSGWHRVGGWIVDHNKLVTAVCLVMMAFTAYGMTRMKTSVQLMRLFSPKAKVVTDYYWLEAHLGELIPMEVVINIDTDREKCSLNFLQRMQLVEKVQKQIESIDEVGSSLSTVTFAPDLPKYDIHRDEIQAAENNPKPKRRGIGGILGSVAGIKDEEKLDRKYRNKNLEEHREDFLAGDYLCEVDGKELWRISARVSALKDVDYAKFVDDIRAAVEPVLEEEKEHGVGGISATYTGLVPLVYKAQNSLLDGLIFGFVTDLVLIVATIILVQRSFSSGVILLLPSLIPVVVVFGAMGWMGIIIDIGTVMTPAVALGVSVDDIVHFMLQFRRALAAGADRKQAVMAAYHHCGRAMYQSWGVIGLGLSVFAMSPFTPTQRFGYMMIALLSAALIGNLLLLPALLAGPLGAMYIPKTRRNDGATPDTGTHGDQSVEVELSVPQRIETIRAESVRAESQRAASMRSEPVGPKWPLPSPDPRGLDASRRSLRR